MEQALRKQGAECKQLEVDCVKQMLEDDSTEPSESLWGSPIVVVTKKCGGTHPCVDYRKLNVTRRDAYPLLDVQMCHDAFAGAKYFCTLDLASGY